MSSPFVLFCPGFIVFNSAGFRSSRMRQGPINFFYVNVLVRRNLSVFEGFYYFFSSANEINTTFKVSHLAFRRFSLGSLCVYIYIYVICIYRCTHAHTLNFCTFHYYTIVRLLLQRRNSRFIPPLPTTKCFELLNYYFSLASAMLLYTYDV